MTYRRLFTNLLIGSTFALVALWWLSLRDSYDFIFSPRGGNFTLSVGLYRATLSLDLNPYEQTDSAFQSSSTPASSLHGSLSDKATGPLGRFSLGRFPTKVVDERLRQHDYFLDIPFWLAYGVFIGSAFGIIKFFENRSSGGKEMTLAEHVVGGNVG